jgi:hypothetical protein
VATLAVYVLSDHTPKPLEDNDNDDSSKNFVALRCFMKLCVFLYAVAGRW